MLLVVQLKRLDLTLACAVQRSSGRRSAPGHVGSPCTRKRSSGRGRRPRLTASCCTPSVCGDGSDGGLPVPLLGWGGTEYEFARGGEHREELLAAALNAVRADRAGGRIACAGDGEGANDPVLHA